MVASTFYMHFYPFLNECEHTFSYILCESKYVRLQKSEVVQCAVFHATPAWSHEAASDAKSSLRAHRSERGIQFVTFSSCQTEFLLHPSKLSGVGL